MRKFEFSVSCVGLDRSGTISTCGLRRIRFRRYEMLLIKKMEPNDGRFPVRESVCSVLITAFTTSTERDVNNQGGGVNRENDAYT